MKFAALKLTAAIAALCASTGLAAAEPVAPTLMVLNVAVDLSGITGDKGTFTVVCKVTEANNLKQNFIDGHTEVDLIHDNINGQYVARYQGTVRVEMKEQYVPPQFNFAKLNTYWCQASMTSDQTKTWSDLPIISGPLPKVSVAVPLATAAKVFDAPALTGQ